MTPANLEWERDPKEGWDGPILAMRQALAMELCDRLRTGDSGGVLVRPA